MEFFIDCDDDGHWYIVPEQHREQWDEWHNLNSDDENSWEVPSFAIQIGGPIDQVIFKEYRIK
ncbi:hypothetical protein KAR91_50280 [Candidatus Pacearchaeota archaeon]|nr:hypothetical protein [Candidatus Pacearchaeota archaeon]